MSTVKMSHSLLRQDGGGEEYSYAVELQVDMLKGGEATLPVCVCVRKSERV